MINDRIKVAFVVPSGKHNFHPFRNQPLSEMYLMTILEEEFGDKIDLSLIDLRGIKEEDFIFRIPKNDVYMYSVATLNYNEISTLVGKIRTVYPDAKHVAGGSHVSIFTKDSSKIFDASVDGEGEEIIKQIIRDIHNKKLQKIYTQDKPVDINAYPYASRKYLPKVAVVDTGVLDGEYKNLRGTAVILSRGCPFNCHFCANINLSYGPVRFRLPHLITEEIEYLKREYEIEALAIKDDNSIPINKKIAEPFLKAIGKTGVKWRGQTRANGVNPDMIKLAKESGCTDLAIGVESASPKVLKRINKKINLDKAKEYVKSVHKEGIGVRLHFIIGLPDEPDDIAQKTLKFIDDLNPKSVLLSLLTPTPGSRLYDHPDEFGIKMIDKNWDDFRTVFGRFDKNEKPIITFKYTNGRKKEDIVNDYMYLQDILRERDLNF